MTKDEAKALVAAEINGQGNQVRASVLKDVLNWLIDKAGNIGGAVLDLRTFNLSVDDTDVTTAVPTGYAPQVGDTVLYGDYALTLSGIAASTSVIYCTFGYIAPEAADELDSLITIKLTKSPDKKWLATYRTV